MHDLFRFHTFNTTVQYGILSIQAMIIILLTHQCGFKYRFIAIANGNPIYVLLLLLSSIIIYVSIAILTAIQTLLRIASSKDNAILYKYEANEEKRRNCNLHIENCSIGIEKAYNLHVYIFDLHRLKCTLTLLS